MADRQAGGRDRQANAAAAAEPRRVAGALLGGGLGLAVLIAGAVAWVWPQAAPVVASATVLVGTLTLWAASRSERRRQSAKAARLAAENRRLTAAVERLSDTAWELQESDERYRALTEARQRAEEASQAKSRVLATVSHEFRTPLNGILGLTGLLLETDLTPDQATYARAVHTSGEALTALVDDMLDFSRIEAGRLDFRPTPTELEPLLQEIAELLAARAHAKGIDIVAEVARDLPHAVMVDATRLRQVLLNLAGNAVKFTDAGGVILSAAPDDVGDIAFSVADTGPGIAADEAERLFGEFEQSDMALARRHGGVGLGLAISRRIVRQMGSDIVMLPRDGGGALFRFSLSLPVVAPGSASAASLAGRSVLLVAPGGTEAPALARGLVDAGAAVRLALTTNEAAALAGAAAAARQPYDALLVDARAAPDPATALTRIRDAAGARVAAAVLIEPRHRNDVTALRTAGFDAYLVRPVRHASLMRVVSELSSGGGGSFRIDPGDAEPRRVTPSRRAGGPLSVLLAEDNEINALLARAVLEGLGHDVREVHDGAAAVAAAGAGNFDVVLMDLHMPGLDGIAAVRAIRENERRTGWRVAILAVTADVLAETRSEALAAGADAIVEKPMTPDALRRALAEIGSRDAA